jgi:hypothetical protein
MNGAGTNAQLLVYSFDSAAAFEGQLVGGLERFQSSSAVTILDALFIQSDADSGELSVVSVQGDRTGDIAAELLLFRLDPAERRRITQKALSDRTRGISAETVRAIGAALEPGSAIAAILVDHRWLGALDDAVARTGGKKVSTQFVGAGDLAEVVPELLAAAQVPRG